MTRVSVGVPVYKGANYLQEALDSLLAQTFTDLEIIIGDNASTDATCAAGERTVIVGRRDAFIPAAFCRELA